MRIDHVNDIAFVGTELVAALRELGVSAALLDPARPGAGLRYPVKAVALPARALALGVVGVRLRSRSADLRHVHYARLGFLGPIGGRPYMLHCHGTDIRGVTPSSGWGRLTAPWLRRAVRVLYSTPDLAPWVLPFRPDAIFLPNPIRAAPSTRAAAQRDLLVGVRLDAVKGPDEIAALLAAVLRRRPATTTTVISQGREVDRVAAAAGPNVRVIPPVPHAELPLVMAAHRVALGQLRLGILSNYELEAMASGLPVATTFSYAGAYDAPPPLVGGGTTEEMAGAVVDLLNDSDRRHAAGEAARRWVAGHHGAAAVASALRDLYVEVLSPGAGSARG